MTTSSYDYLIIGSGIAGLYAAILAEHHGSVAVLTKGSIEDTNTRWAQGGIAAPIGPGDSPEKHFQDTIVAGAGLVDEDAARVLTTEAADRIRDLVALGVPFDTLHGEIALAMEGAHSQPRILHAGGDSTGAMELTPPRRLPDRITVLENTIATELLRDSHAVVGMDERTGVPPITPAATSCLPPARWPFRVSVTNPEVASGNIALAAPAPRPRT
jgi:L-aspartate oxidase